MAPAPMPVNVPDPDFQILTLVNRKFYFFSEMTRVTWTKGLPGTRQAAIRLELLRVIAEAREARMVEMVENLRNSTEFSTNEIRAMVDDPATKAQQGTDGGEKGRGRNDTEFFTNSGGKCLKS
ncbi:hypothetical protein OIU85_014091 [Salix viminalis]|uniref:Uncharacterized protein n=1 Tax=Salix viminalis TaxID=40686 RepID=A0A9Q0SCM0_SALVM|nr:hypothetical protein OIU85_014091 [Salix viminalis]